MFIAGFVVLFLFATSPSLGQRLARTLSVVLPLRFRAKAEVSAYLLIEGLGALRSPRKLLIISILSAPVWLAEAVVYYIVAISFDLELPFHAIVLVTVTSNLATAIPSSIGGIGPFEVVAKTSLVAFGVGAEAAAAYSFFVHILALWLPVNILGLVFLWKENMSLAQLARSKQIQISFIPESSEDGPVEYADGSVATAEGEGE